MVYFSTFLYPFVKMHGDGWRSALAAEMQRGPRSNIPAVRTWAACTEVDVVTLSASGPSRLAPARSQEAGKFLASSADVWVSCDDDVCCVEGVAALVAAA